MFITSHANKQVARRKAIEEKYSKELDSMYTAAYGPPEDVTIFTLSPFVE